MHPRSKGYSRKTQEMSSCEARAGKMEKIQQDGVFLDFSTSKMKDEMDLFSIVGVESQQKMPRTLSC